MTNVLAVNEEFRFADGHDRLRRARARLAEIFPDRLIEFFYYIKPTETARFLIIRVPEVAAAEFAAAVTQTIRELNFTPLDDRQAQAFFRRTPALEDYR